MRPTILALLLVGAASVARADVLLLDAVQAESSTASTRPTRGMSMDRVEATFGTPVEKHAAVGQPPITRWDYPGFSVYFEYQYVIHAVPAHEAEPAKQQ
jgi:hypothetical protein